MARKPRVEFDGAFYHVIVRGNQRQRTFHDDRDRIAYLERIARRATKSKQRAEGQGQA